jgi:uncharacterized protein YggL (DUF469 family)
MSAACPELGFDLSIQLAPGLSEAGQAALWAALVGALEARGLSTAGGAAMAWRTTVVRDGGQAVDADREALRAWAAAQGGIAEATVGPLVDLRLAAG